MNNPYELIDPSSAVFWFRRDLRLEDNVGLAEALRRHQRVVPVFIFDTNILSKLDSSDCRVEFIHEALSKLNQQLGALGSTLVTFIGDPVDIFKIIQPAAVYTNHDYEPYARRRDHLVADLLRSAGIPFQTFKDQVIFEKREVCKEDGSPYTVFTPYSRKWRSQLTPSHYSSHTPALENLHKLPWMRLPDLPDLGFGLSGKVFPNPNISADIIRAYHDQRNLPGIEGTTRLGVHLRFGTVSIRKAVRVALDLSETWLNELIWREFFQSILWNFPHVEQRAFKPAYDSIAWRNDEHEFDLWCRGRTGYPMVDAGMRELVETGFMHNRVRMITASFLTKHLLIDWRWGEAFFAKHLLDFDLASNNGGWQWAAGSGCDAAPYFRIFNPHAQLAKFDPEKTYVKKWLPDMETPSYPRPVVDHNFARERALSIYQQAIST